MNMQDLLKQKQNVVYDIHPDASMGICIEMLNERRIGALIVRSREDVLEGIITERDVLRAVSARRGAIWDLPVREVMTPKERLITVTMEEPVQSIMERMTNNRVRHIPIIEGGKVIGLVSIGDVVKFLLDQAVEENEQMKEYIYGRYASGGAA